MEEQRVSTFNKSQRVLSYQDFDQFEGCGYGWCLGVELGEREGKGLFGGHCLVDVDRCAGNLYQFYGMFQSASKIAMLT